MKQLWIVSAVALTSLVSSGALLANSTTTATPPVKNSNSGNAPTAPEQLPEHTATDKEKDEDDVIIIDEEDEDASLEQVPAKDAEKQAK